MKRTINLVLILVLISIVFLAGCQAKKETAKDTAAKTSKLNDLYLLGATQGGGGVWDMVGTGLGSAIQQKIPGSKITFVPGEGVANTATLNQGKGDLALLISSIAAAGAKGEAPYKEVCDKVRGITSLYDSRTHVIAMKNYPINSLADLKEKKLKARIAVGDPGSSQEYNSNKLLAEYGYTYSDIESWGGKVFYKSMGEAADMMGDGLLDVLIISGTTPMGAVQEIANAKELKMLPIDEKIINNMVEKCKYVPAVIPKGAYNFVKEDYKTFAHQVILGTNTMMSDEDVYKITKALVENLDFIHGIHKNLAGLTPQIMATGTGVPLHPGAEKYYREIGAVK